MEDKLNQLILINNHFQLKIRVLTITSVIFMEIMQTLYDSNFAFSF